MKGYYWSQGAAIFLLSPTLEDFDNMEKFLKKEREELENRLPKKCPTCGRDEYFGKKEGQ